MAAEPHAFRDFPGRALLINLLRVVHLVGLAGVSAGLLGAASATLPGYATAMLASGIGILGLDVWSNPQYLREGRGLAMLAKIALVMLMLAWEAYRLPIFWLILVASVAVSHAPGRLRHRRFF